MKRIQLRGEQRDLPSFLPVYLAEHIDIFRFLPVGEFVVKTGLARNIKSNYQERNFAF
jgi:hypothetical protein